MCKGRKNRSWEFPGEVDALLRLELSGKKVLHLFGGRAGFGTRLDIDPIVRPNVIGDAWLPPFPKDSFDAVILDPPYQYVNSVMKLSLLRTAAFLARETVVYFHTIWINDAPCCKLKRSVLVVVGRNCHVRALQFFQVVKKPSQIRYFKRGPAIKYNRWLAQPQGFAFPDPQKT